MSVIGQKSLGNFVNGTWACTSGGVVFASSNPVHPAAGEIFRVVENSYQNTGAGTAAQKASAAWSALSRDERVAFVQKLIPAIDRHADELAEAITTETGKPIFFSNAEVGLLKTKIAQCVQQIADFEIKPTGLTAAQRVHYQGRGAYAVVGPSNFPVHMVHTYVIALLLTGNTVVVKVSDMSPLTAQIYGKIFKEAGLPDGVFNLVQGRHNMVNGMVTDPNIDGLVFTGSRTVGKILIQQLTDQGRSDDRAYSRLFNSSFELGSKNAALVLADADVKQTVRELVLGITTNAGQVCTGTDVIFCERSIANAIRDGLVIALGKIPTRQDPMDPQTWLGPLAGLTAYHRYEKLIQAAQKEKGLVWHHNPLLNLNPQTDGCFVPPALVEIKKGRKFFAARNTALLQEFFAPLGAFIVVEDREEAFRQAEALARLGGGLSSALFTADVDAGIRQFLSKRISGRLQVNTQSGGLSGLLPIEPQHGSGFGQPSGWLSLRMGVSVTGVAVSTYGAVAAHPILTALGI
jgi:acyl-CoA reductase-like NAD-dependent aldehyde dehydrogenase